MTKFLNNADFGNVSGNPFITLNASRKSRWAWVIFFVILSIIFGVLVLIKIPETIKIDIILNKSSIGENEFYISLPKFEGNQKRMKSGQIIQLRLDGYQNTKFGYIPAKINKISINTDNTTTVFLYAYGGLVTNKQNVVHYKSGLKGNVVVFVKNASLLFRLFDKLKF